MRLRFPPLSLQAHILITMVLMAGMAVSLSGVLVTALQERAITSNAVRHLEQIRERAYQLADEGIDPFTGQPFTSSSQYLEAHLKRTLSGPDEGEIGFLAGKIAWVGPTGLGLHPENDRELVAGLAPYLVAEDSVIFATQTSTGRYQVLVIPVSFGEDQGALVHVINIEERADQLHQVMFIYAWVAVFSMIVVTALAWIMVERLLRPIGQLREAAESIDEHDLTSRVPVRRRDDLGVLAKEFNRMLDRVQLAVQSQRDLADDVGHELRTPITVVRGHLEVLDPNDPADVEQTRVLAIDELDRMGRLINDLLTLAKSSQSDFVQPVACDVDQLTEQVFDKAKALGAHDWSAESLAHTVAVLDPARITQAWLQLCTNAVKYSSPGSTITLGSRVESNELLLWVHDEGIGISAAEIDQVRRRAVRSSEVIHGPAPGSGLGLTIVDSIMKAHGGGLDIESAPGIGSTFTLRLPLSPAERPGSQEE